MVGGGDYPTSKETSASLPLKGNYTKGCFLRLFLNDWWTYLSNVFKTKK
jgi:hypothetical protein